MSSQSEKGLLSASFLGAGLPRRSKKSSAHSSVESFDDSHKHDVPGEGATRVGGQPALKLFESTLKHERKRSTPMPSSKQPEFINISGPRSLAMPNSFNAAMDTQPEAHKNRIEDGYMRETPEFKRYEDATNIELFYDLFFVANLTTFTDVHEINAVPALKAYAGFFCILWFLWVQVSLFDVRFVQDSILERIGKVCQFGVMVGLAIVGPTFNPEAQVQTAFQSLAIILMISRILLAFQYAAVLYDVWHYQNTRVPLSLVVGANSIAAFVYFTTFLGFKKDTPHNLTFIVWYFTAVIETAVNISISSRWEVLTFKGTHLIKRMSLLTLIILGEGIIAIAKSIATITEKEEAWNGALLFTIVTAVIIVYFTYMIYFDWMNREHFGSLREGLWAFLHFPFHLALVLLVEGAAQFIVWRKVVEVVRYVDGLFVAAEEGFVGRDSQQFAGLLSNVTDEIFTKFKPVFTHTLRRTTETLSLIGSSAFNSTEQLKEMVTLFATIQDSIFDNFGIEPPEVENSDPDPNEEWTKNEAAFKLIFVYFFVAAGITLILMDALNFLSRPRPNRGDYIRMLINLIVGITLAAIASMVNTDQGFAFAQSALILPTVALAFVLVMMSTYHKVLK
ncbi:hypothetical protein VTL71DRAFT_6940 [Oculimacula yallundae]|uniref:Low temperature requirement A n=1 Tax=Oculimacula yallundae TaxID=86028 RepID=A0ABR4BVC1_9HELO